MPSSDEDTARRIRGGPDELSDEESDDELELDAVVSDELLDARLNRGRSGSLSSDELDELLLSSRLEFERRNTGRLDEPDELADEEEEDDDPSDGLGSGAVSSVCSEASECSSAVPTRTIRISCPLYALVLSSWVALMLMRSPGWKSPLVALAPDVFRYLVELVIVTGVTFLSSSSMTTFLSVRFRSVPTSVVWLLLG